jgi:hypothetical protein
MAQIDWIPDRRRAVRVELLTQLQGQLLALDEEVRIRQVSLGGLQLESSAPLSLREVHDLRIGFESQSAVVTARVLHSRVSINSDQVSYLSGVELIAPSPEAVSILTALMAQFPAPPAL